MVKSLTLADAEAGLCVAQQNADEVEAMLLIAQRQRQSLLEVQDELKEVNASLLGNLLSRRRSRNSKDPIYEMDCAVYRATDGGSESSGSTMMSEAQLYDWVCEITKLSDVSTHGWQVRYSEPFLASISDHEKRYVLGTEPVTFKSKSMPTPKGSAHANSIDTSQSLSHGEEEQDPVSSPRSASTEGWDGAVVAVLGLFDKGKTFVLNHLTESQLPSGKKVATKGLSFKHVCCVQRENRRKAWM